MVTNQTQPRYFYPGQPTTAVQNPYNNLLVNSPYDNYMGRNQFLKCRPVSSKEEAMAFQIDLDGSLWVFPNVANGKIYTKQINNDGTASFGTYVYTEEKTSQPATEYVTKEQFNQTIKTLLANLQTQTKASDF